LEKIYIKKDSTFDLIYQIPLEYHSEAFQSSTEVANFENVLVCSAVSTTPAKNLSPVALTPAINPCQGEITKKPKIFRRCQRHRRKTVHHVNDTADKLFGGVNDTGDLRVLPILACLHLKIKNKQKFNL
jgi:hypothetical protein